MAEDDKDTDIELIRKLLALLDRIDIEQDPTLARQRFAIFEEYGEVIWEPKVSARLQ